MTSQVTWNKIQAPYHWQETPPEPVTARLSLSHFWHNYPIPLSSLCTGSSLCLDHSSWLSSHTRISSMTVSSPESTLSLVLCMANTFSSFRPQSESLPVSEHPFHSLHHITLSYFPDNTCLSLLEFSSLLCHVLFDLPLLPHPLNKYPHEKGLPWLVSKPSSVPRA